MQWQVYAEKWGIPVQFPADISNAFSLMKYKDSCNIYTLGVADTSTLLHNSFASTCPITSSGGMMHAQTSWTCWSQPAWSKIAASITTIWWPASNRTWIFSFARFSNTGQTIAFNFSNCSYKETGVEIRILTMNTQKWFPLSFNLHYCLLRCDAK